MVEEKEGLQFQPCHKFNYHKTACSGAFQRSKQARATHARTHHRHLCRDIASLSSLNPMASLQGYVDRRVLLVLQDGRSIVVCISAFYTCTYTTYHQYSRGFWLGLTKSPTLCLQTQKNAYTAWMKVSKRSHWDYIWLRVNLCALFIFIFIFLSLMGLRFTLRCLIGEIDEEIDKSTDLSTIHAEPIPPIRYG